MMFVTKKEVKKHFRFVHSTKKEKLKGSSIMGVHREVHLGHLILKFGHLVDFADSLWVLIGSYAARSHSHSFP